MQRTYTGRISFGTIARTLCTTATLCFLAACTGPSYNTWVEETRVTSPDGRFDAVITREASPGGVLGSLYWNVFIVPKGDSAPKNNTTSVFDVGHLRGENLVWRQNHHLEIHYTRVNIELFQNLWALSQLPGHSNSKGKNDYFIEVHLVPASDTSLLTADGDFKDD